MRRINLSKKQIILAIILVVSVGFLYQILRNKTYLSREDVTTQIKQKLPNGSSVADVERFVSTYKAEFPVSIGSYTKIEPSMKNYTAVQDGPPNADGYLLTRIDRTGQWQLFEEFMYVTFYFDEHQKLIGYSVRVLADAI
ncbi:MAG: hypothetical protein SF097_06640 [Acidobacteriota bacterium]|nr:hypothetical protein [Acidobacteriota bacterium]